MRNVPRPGFDGSFIEDRRRELAWLIIGGYRYHIDAEASSAMFTASTKPVQAVELVDDIPLKGAIRVGSRLVRGHSLGPIHLFAVDLPENRLHTVVSYESFVQFGFSMEKVMVVPDGLLGDVPPGDEICSALDRITRRGHSMYLPLLEVLD
jgi:hypothetical protein